VAETEESLEDLAAAAKAGSVPAFERIVEETKDRLFNYVLQLVRNEHDAEDLTQEAFIKAFRNLHSFDGRARFTTWLYTIAKNSAFSHLRRRRLHQPIEDWEEVLAAEISAERDDSIWKLARGLKPKFYETLWLFYAEGFSLKETAAIMNTNLVTVRVNLYRARAALGKKLRFANEWAGRGRAGGVAE
jgi:RNA polymerase sigma-70 factor (ECF subfamily)